MVKQLGTKRKQTVLRSGSESLGGFAQAKRRYDDTYRSNCTQSRYVGHVYMPWLQPVVDGLLNQNWNYETRTSTEKCEQKGNSYAAF
jgi:hypothetical protein